MKLKRISYGIFCLIFVSLNASGQNKRDSLFSKNAVYVEAGGNAILYSINYDRIFLEKNKFKLCVRAGCEFWGYRLKYSKEFHQSIFPFEICYLSGKKYKFFETGPGATLIFSNRNYQKNDYFLFYRIGYRLQRPNGFLFRAGFLFLIFHNPNEDWGLGYNIFPWAGFSFGKTF